MIVSAMNACYYKATECVPHEIVRGYKGVIGLTVLNPISRSTPAEYLSNADVALRKIHAYVEIANFYADKQYLKKINGGELRAAITVGQRV